MWTASLKSGVRLRVLVAVLGAALVSCASAAAATMTTGSTGNAASAAAEPGVFPSPQVDGDVIHKRVVPALHPSAHRDLSVSDAHWLGEAAPLAAAEEHARLRSLGKKHTPDGAPLHKRGAGVGTTASAPGPITYHGGPVMTGNVKAYAVFYGAWSSNSKTIVSNFLSQIGGSSWYGTQTKYYSQSGSSQSFVSNSVTYGGSVSISSSTGGWQGTNLRESSIAYILLSAFYAGLPMDGNAVYFVLTSPEVSVAGSSTSSGFCSSYCGWHGSASINRVTYQYSFVGNPERCVTSSSLGGCMVQSASPNGDRGVDAMVSVIAHELVETVSDPGPNFSSWYDSAGRENADKCAWTYGSVSRASTGAYSNVQLGGNRYLIQQNWDPVQQACTLGA